MLRISLGAIMLLAWMSASNAAIETFARTTLAWKILPNGPSSQTVRSDPPLNGSPSFSQQIETYGTAEAEAKFGSLKIYAESIRLPAFDAIGGRSASGLAWYVDEFTIFGGTGTGTTSFGIFITGAHQSTADLGLGSDSGGYAIQAFLDPNGANTPIIDSSTSSSTRNFTGTGTTIQKFADGTAGDVEFTFGVPFEMKVLFSAFAQVDPVGGPFVPSNELQSHSVMNLRNTATTYFDLPEGATLSAASGASYFVGPLPVPLPPAILLMLPGLITLKLSRRKDIANKVGALTT